MTDEKFNLEMPTSVFKLAVCGLSYDFLTVIGEAISNSWDADASNVWITFDYRNSSVTIKDDGVGMTCQKFQGKFLKVGYSRRKNCETTTQKQRNTIGCKGIGILALISNSARVSIKTKTSTTNCVGGVIDCLKLNNAVNDEIETISFELEDFTNFESNDSYFSFNQGTLIKLEGICNQDFSDLKFLRERIALDFPFYLYDSNFNIYVNNQLISLDDCREFSNNLEFYWRINECPESILSLFDKNAEVEKLHSDLEIKGFLATMKLPKSYCSKDADRYSVNLYVNGRLRERNIMKHIKSNLFLDNYLCGQIHFDSMESLYDDPFTTNRQAVKNNNVKFLKLIEVLRIFTHTQLPKQWEDRRMRKFVLGEQKNTMNLSTLERLSLDFFNQSVSILCTDLDSSDNINKVIKQLKIDSCNNFSFYQYLYIIENLMRYIIVKYDININAHSIDNINKYQSNEDDLITKTETEFEIRKERDGVNYLGIRELSSNLIGEITDWEFPTQIIKIAMYRNIVAHTGQLSLDAEMEARNLNSEIIKKLVKFL